MADNTKCFWGCRQDTISNLSSVEIWGPYMTTLADVTIEKSIYQYREKLLNILCSFNIIRERISTLTAKNRIQFNIQGCVKTEWQVVHLLGHTSHQTLLILYQIKVIMNSVSSLRPIFGKNTKLHEGRGAKPKC